MKPNIPLPFTSNAKKIEKPLAVQMKLIMTSKQANLDLIACNYDTTTQQKSAAFCLH